jgi:hypothetical protein
MKRAISALTLLRRSGPMALALATIHCGGGGDASPSTATDAGPNMTDDGGAPTPHADAACTPSGMTDDPDDNGVDANCDGADGVAGVDVYVSETAGADTNSGTPAAAMRTIGAAVALAASRNGRVLVAGGTYPVDAYSLTSEAHVFGGYAPSFLGAPMRALTILSASATGLPVDAQAKKVSLAHVTVHGDAASHAEQPSAYGVRVKSGDVTLDDVDVVAGDALGGKAGAPGARAPAIDSSLACDGVVQPSYVRGASGPAADGTLPGDFKSGAPAPQTHAGSPGSDGDDAPATPKIVDGLFAASGGTDGRSDGTAGYGGAGGGTGTVTQGSYAGDTIWLAGTGGSGGCPGKGGGAGTSGGSSVAVLVVSGSLHVTRSRLRTGAGGSGGDGGEGGTSAGGLGTMPVPYGNVAWMAAGTTCADPSTDPLDANCAGFGGKGGDGGAGGHGGGGAGGSSIAIATANGAMALVDDATAYELGRAGSGGIGHGGGRAQSGRSTRMTVIP